MTALLLAACLLAAPGGSPPAAAVVGTVRLTRAAGAPLVSVVADDGDEVHVQGGLTQEVARLQSARVEVLGRREGRTMYVEQYRILDVGGIKPMFVGVLVHTGSGLALSDGGGTPIPLSLAAATRARLQAQDGAKLWVYGKKLVTGELRVLRYGILRDAPSVESGARK